MLWGRLAKDKWVTMRGQKHIDDDSDLDREEMIQRFKYTFELAWKTLKDYLESSGVILTESAPKKVVKECVAVTIFGGADASPPVLDVLIFDSPGN